jgi:hypothetical protein
VTTNEVISAPPPDSPLAIVTAACIPAGGQAEYRAVTASVPLGAFGNSNVVTKSAFFNLEDGLAIVFQAPMGLHGKNVWRVMEAETESEAGTGKRGLVLVEEATLIGLTPLMPFIMLSDGKSHAEQAANFARKLESSSD